MRALIAGIGLLLCSIAVHAETGIASVYNYGPVACPGRHFGGMTAAHKSLPCGTKVRVTNHGNGRSVVVTVVDRGPFIRGRIIDLTPTAAHALGFSGLAHVTVEPYAPRHRDFGGF